MTSKDRNRIALAIAQAERGTSGRIAVRVLHESNVDAFERAKREFELAGLHRHETGNAALILIAPKARSFAVIGDAALHERVGDEFWQLVADDMRSHFAYGKMADGVVAGVERIGEALQTHFAEEATGP
ncbi:MAG: TPM domain-containing protein [Candidatus Eremiobacteraeota bacterium]|nr:TPM domain-containing protein [Candidatus Eremiobacteraeota bacterium]